jgi:predicted RNA-binding protein with PUA-like domain
MADITYIEKANIEALFGMKSGYVMDFSDRTFNEFVGEATGLDIFEEKYHYSSNSKANRLRGFMKVESNYVVGKLLGNFCDYWLSKAQTNQINWGADENLHKECLHIVERLKSESIVEHLEALRPNSDAKDFDLLAKSIKESIKKNEPEAALDRLHTFVIKYVRQLCDNHGLSHDKDEPLHSLFGKYVKKLLNDKYIDSVMSEKILRFSINVLDAFNDVRNNKSLAHDNPVLNYHESILIFNSITNTIKFIDTIENKILKSKEPTQAKWNELPF